VIKVDSISIDYIEEDSYPRKAMFEGDDDYNYEDAT